MTEARRNVLAPALLAALLALPPSAPAALLGGDYEDGVAAVERGDWERAVTLLEMAVADRPEEKKRALFTGGHRYLPHLYLGLARCRDGDYAGGVEALRESERQGVAGELSEGEILERELEECGASLRALERVLAEARDEIASARELASAAAELGSDPHLAGAWVDEGMGSRLEAARALVEIADGIVESGGAGPRLDEVDRALRVAGEAARSLAALTAEARRVVDEERERAEQERHGLAALVEGTDSLLSSTAELEPYPPGLEALREEVEGLLAEAGAVDERTPWQQVADLQARLDAARGELEARGRFPEMLQAAAVHFLEGRYEEVLETLAGVDFAAGRPAAHACLLRAAAGFALYRAGHRRDPALERSARERAAECRRLEPTLRASRRLFSPAFLELLDGS